MPRRKITEPKEVTQETKKPEVYKLKFYRDFKGNINNHVINHKAGDITEVPKIVYDFVKQFNVAE